MSFVTVYEADDSCDGVEVPIEDEDSAVLLSTLAGQWPRVCGLRYRGTGPWRAVKMELGRLKEPPGGWEGLRVVCVSHKQESDNKRKCETGYDDCVAKTKRLEGRKCTDLIVLNIGWKVDEDSLRKYFSKFGELVLVQIKRDRESNQSKGYAFIRYADYESQVLCLSDQHLIDGRWCAVKIPFSKSEADKQEISKKVHVAYTSEEISMEDLRNIFEEYGYVTDIFIPKPFRNFAFVTFDSQDSVQSLIGRTLIKKGHALTIGSAVPKINNNKKTGLLQIPVYPENNQAFVGQFGWSGYESSFQGPYRPRQHMPGPSNYVNNYSGLLPNHSQPYMIQSRRSDMSYGTQPSDMGQNTAAMAALNILNNPSVVAAIVAAANKSGGTQKYSNPHGSLQS